MNCRRRYARKTSRRPYVRKTYKKRPTDSTKVKKYVKREIHR